MQMVEPVNQYQLVLEERPGYLYACVKADSISPEIAAAYWREIAERCSAAQCTRLLVIRDIRQMLPIGALFLQSERIQSMIGGVRVAFINPYPETNERFDFGLMVGTNRGADYSRFESVEAAEKWLLNS
jgi:hypothetical protein